MFTSIFAVALAAVAIPLLSRSISQEPFNTDPIVGLDYGAFEGLASDGTSSFLGIPFAAPPVGRLRFAAPQPPLHFSGLRSAKEYGPGCYQQNLTAHPELGLPSHNFASKISSEDCLSINVIVPEGVMTGADLPVVFNIHGGGFAIGSTSAMDIGTLVVNRSIELGHPIVYVSANYRVNAFGFLASEEIKAAGGLNAGLLDQRMALRWTQRYISTFGGDPEKVIVIGGSAGGVSIGLHMLANGGDIQGLFRGAVLMSGSAMTSGSYTTGQPYYDQLASLTGCSSGERTLACLRQVPSEALVEAVNKMPDIMGHDSFKLAWSPRVGGDYVVEDPVISVEEKRVANIPFINVADDDEGTIFSLSSLNVTTDAEFKKYIQYLTGMSEDQVKRVAELYPDDPSEGSPFGTGDKWQLSPQYKRISAFTGDWLFQGPRRHMLRKSMERQHSWSYIFKMGKNRSFLGATHGADSSAARKSRRGYDFLINFAYNLDPNVAVSPASALKGKWPTYGSLPDGALLEFTDDHGIHVVQDTFREEALELLEDIKLGMAGWVEDGIEVVDSEDDGDEWPMIELAL